MFTCPHCERRGISFLHKLTASLRYRAVCRYCRQSSGHPRGLHSFVLIVMVVFFAASPYLVSDATRDNLAIAVVLALIGIVLALPLSKRM